LISLYFPIIEHISEIEKLFGHWWYIITSFLNAKGNQKRSMHVWSHARSIGKLFFIVRRYLVGGNKALLFPHHQSHPERPFEG